MRRKLAVLALLIAMFTSVSSFLGTSTASACPLFTLPTLGGGGGGGCDDDGDRGGNLKDYVESIDW